MAFLAYMSMKPEMNALKAAAIQRADPVKERVSFCYYRLAKGVSGILSCAREGIRLRFTELSFYPFQKMDRTVPLEIIFIF